MPTLKPGILSSPSGQVTSGRRARRFLNGYRLKRDAMAEMETGASASKPSTRSKKDWARILQGVRGTVTYEASLRSYTSFRIGGPAEVLGRTGGCGRSLPGGGAGRAEKIPIFVVGGTNLLVRDGGIRGIVVSLREISRRIRQEPDHVLYAEGGVGMPTLIGYAVRRSLAGLEWGAGIPGTVAGCVVMNAGTRLGEMKDSVKAVRMIDPRGRVLDIPAADIPFSYRRAHLPPGIVVGRLVAVEARRAQPDRENGEGLFAVSQGHSAADVAECRLRVQESAAGFGRSSGRGGGLKGRSGRGCPGVRKTCEFHGQRRSCAGPRMC